MRSMMSLYRSDVVLNRRARTLLKSTIDFSLAFRNASSTLMERGGGSFNLAKLLCQRLNQIGTANDAI